MFNGVLKESTVFILRWDSYTKSGKTVRMQEEGGNEL
jgi:hypothetical protein